MKKHQTKSKSPQTSSKRYEVIALLLHCVMTVYVITVLQISQLLTLPMHEVVDPLDYEYEDFDNCNQPQEYEIVQPSVPSAKQSSVGDFKLTQCPAYSPFYGSREVALFWTSSARVHSDSRRSSSTVADCRRLSPKVADSRRSSPIRDRKIRAMKIKFANALWPTCAKCACEKLTFEVSLYNDVKRPQDGPFGW